MEERILTALAGTSGMSAKELGKVLGEPTPIVTEQLRTMAGTGTLKQRQVGRDQVFSLAKKAVPTPREIAPGNWFQPGPPHTTLPASVTVWECCKCHHRRADMPGDPFGPCEKCGTASGLHGIYSPDPALTGHTISELIEDGHLPPLQVPVPQFIQKVGRVRRNTQPVIIDFDQAAALPVRDWKLPNPTLYDRIGGTITLEIGDSPIKARFQSVEQLHRFLTDLIETEQAGQVPAGRKV